MATKIFKILAASIALGAVVFFGTELAIARGGGGGHGGGGGGGHGGGGGAFQRRRSAFQRRGSAFQRRRSAFQWCAGSRLQRRSHRDVTR